MRALTDQRALGKLTGHPYLYTPRAGAPRQHHNVSLIARYSFALSQRYSVLTYFLLAGAYLIEYSQVCH